MRAGDGRLARSERTRAAAARALLDLVREGELSPTVNEVAARTGVTARSLYVHFPSVDDLHRAASDLATAEVLEMIAPIEVDQPLGDRVRDLCQQRAIIHEHLSPLRRAARRREHASPALAESRRTAREASRDQLTRIFAAELAELTEAARRRRLAALDAAASDDAWSLWRDHHDLSVAVARQTMAESLTALLPAADT